MIAFLLGSCVFGLFLLFSWALAMAAADDDLTRDDLCDDDDRPDGSDY